jgi:ketosteroid isomerase-like protein
MKTPLKFIFALLAFWGLAGLTTVSAQKCIDERKVQPEQTCPRSFDDPVCGCNDQTYANVCEAERNGVTKWTPGTCKGSVEESYTKFVKDWEAAYNKADYRALGVMFSKDAVQFLPDGVTAEGPRNIADRYQKFFANQKAVATIKVADVVPLCGGFVSSSGTYTVETASKADQQAGLTRGSYVVLAQQVDGEWKIVRHHLTEEPGRAVMDKPLMEKAPRQKAPVRN